MFNGKLKINVETRTILFDRTFAKRCYEYGTDEYEALKQAKIDYPNYEVKRKRIKRPPNKCTYKGLTYDRMEEFINEFAPASKKIALLDEFNLYRDYAKYHKYSYSYPKIKKWFLQTFPEYVTFGMDEQSEEAPQNKIIAA